MRNHFKFIYKRYEDPIENLILIFFFCLFTYNFFKVNKK